MNVSESIRRFGIVLIIAIISLSGAFSASAQRVSDAAYRTIGNVSSDGIFTDGSYRTVAHFNTDGTITDAAYRTVGHISSDGTVTDKAYRTVGRVSSDGMVSDHSYRTIGHIRSDGTVTDASYRTIGHASELPPAIAAVIFFFDIFCFDYKLTVKTMFK